MKILASLMLLPVLSLIFACSTDIEEQSDTSADAEVATITEQKKSEKVAEQSKIEKQKENNEAYERS